MITVNGKEVLLDEFKRMYQYRSDADAHTICLLIDRVRKLTGLSTKEFKMSGVQVEEVKIKGNKACIKFWVQLEQVVDVVSDTEIKAWNADPLMKPLKITKEDWEKIVDELNKSPVV